MHCIPFKRLGLHYLGLFDIHRFTTLRAFVPDICAIRFVDDLLLYPIMVAHCYSFPLEI